MICGQAAQLRTEDSFAHTDWNVAILPPNLNFELLVPHLFKCLESQKPKALGNCRSLITTGPNVGKASSHASRKKIGACAS